MRHLETKSLWVQQGLKERKFALHAIATETNPSDVHTKALTAQRFETLRSLLGVIEDDTRQKSARVALLAGMLVSSVRRKAANYANVCTLAAVLMASSLGAADGYALQPRGETFVTIRIPASAPYLTILVTILCIIFGMIAWWCCRPKAAKKQGPHGPIEDVYPVNDIHGPIITRAGTRVHLSNNCPFIQGHGGKAYPVCDHCHRIVSKRYERVE